MRKQEHNTNGLKTDYYNIDTKGKEFVDVDHIAMVMQFSFAEATILKSLFGVAKSRREGVSRHSGTSLERDLNKIKHYAKVIEEYLNE